MTTYKELLAQREALEQQIAEARRNEISQAVAEIREKVTMYGLTATDIFGGPVTAKRSSSTLGKTVPPKYRNPNTGETWTGRGKPPKWIADQNRDQYLIP